MYGFLISAGILIAALIAERAAKKEGKESEILWGAVFWSVAGGIIGARLYHVIDFWELYSANLPAVLMFWNGGLGIYGGIAGGLLGAAAYLKMKKVEDIWSWLDLAGVVLPLAQSIGRWGNYFNNELFGYPTTMPWGIYIARDLRPEAYKSYIFFHPLFLYESLLNLLLFIFLAEYYSRSVKRHSGEIFLGYLIGYSAIRLILEELRIAPWEINGLNVAQLVSILVIIVSLILLGINYAEKKN